MLYFSASARFFDGFHARDDSGPAAALVTQPPLALLAWLHAYQPNKLAWGGARHGGKRRATPQAPLLSRWVRILSMTSDSSTHDPHRPTTGPAGLDVEHRIQTLRQVTGAQHLLLSVGALVGRAPTRLNDRCIADVEGSNRRMQSSAQ